MERWQKLTVWTVGTCAAISLSGCGGESAKSADGGGSGATKVNIQLNFIPGGYHAGLAAAVEEGYFKDEGLDVTLTPGTGSGATAQLLASGKADVGWAEPGATMRLIQQGAPLKVVMTLSQSSSTGVTSLKKSNLTDIKQLEGKKFGFPAEAAGAPLVPLMYSANGLKNVTNVNIPVTSMVPGLLSGDVDAILGSADSYNIQLEQRGEEINFQFLSDIGVPIQGVGLVARNDFAQENPDTLKKVIAATLKGWKFAAANQPKAVEDLTKLFPSVKKEQAAAELEATPQLFCKNNAKQIGKSEPEAWAKSYELLTEAGVLKAGTDPTKFYTYDYLPADMEAC